STRPKRIAFAAGGEASKIGLTRDHVCRRGPIGPLGFTRDLLDPRPSEAFTTDPDPVADRPALAENEVEVGIRGIDDDGAGCNVSRIRDDLPPQLGRHLERLGLARQWRQTGAWSGGKKRSRHGGTDPNH